MIFYENEFNIDSQIKHNLCYITNELDINNLKEQHLTKTLEAICDTIGKLNNFDNPDKVFNILSNLKTSLDDVRYNIECLNELLNLLRSLDSVENKDTSIIQSYNELYSNKIPEIYSNNVFIENFFINYTEFYKSFYQEILDKYFASSSVSSDVSKEQPSVQEGSSKKNSTQEERPQKTSQEEDSQEDMPQDKSSQEKSAQEDIVKDNNILLVSETKGKVFLPYKVQQLEKILEEKKNKYKNLDDVIINEFVLPISYFKNPMFSRFKEAFSLMRNKEKSSLFEALSLALELSKNSFLNPAIITACNNLNELDIYLDYLEDNTPEKFDIFKIEYEIPPAKR